MAASGNCRILLVDDHVLVRQGIAQMLTCEPDFEIAAEAGDSATALVRLRELDIDLVILDLVLGQESGLDLLKRIMIESPQVQVLVLSMHEDRLYAERVIRAGARGYITKAAATETLISAIRTIIGGSMHLGNTVKMRMVERMTKSGPDAAYAAPVDSLTDRELEVLRLIGHGNTTAQIAALLKRSVKTIEAHKSALKTKLQVDSAPQLLRAALQHLGPL